MTNYCLSIVRPNKDLQDDGLSKPKGDINKILSKIGFETITQKILVSKKDKIFRARSCVNNICRVLNEGDWLLVHFPTDMGPFFDSLLTKKMNEKGIKSIAFIHDIDPLRFRVPFYQNLRNQIGRLNKFTKIISPNAIMTKKLRAEGLIRPVGDLRVFDYLSQNKLPKKIVPGTTVSFTGNLNKSTFIFDLEKYSSIDFNLYGPINDAIGLGIRYKGSYRSDVLLSMINSGYGLIWDGQNCDYIDKSKVSSGSYLQYNNPYKLSFYLAAGIPVLIWKDAAESAFVVENNVGFEISSISDIDSIISNTSDYQYREMVANVEKVRQKLNQGYFTLKAVRTAMHAMI